MVEPLPAQQRIVVVRNPRSGTAPEPSSIARAAQFAGIRVTVADAPAGSALQPWLTRVAADFDVIVAAGGDGTVSSVAAAVAAAGKTLGVIPAGTLNHFARDAGIPTELDDAVALIKDAHTRGVDIGLVNGRVFLNNVSLGNYPRMVHERERLESGRRPRAIATALAVARTWWRLGKLTAHVKIDGRPR